MSVKFYYIDGVNIKWVDKLQAFIADGDQIEFKTMYRLINAETKESRLFDFVMSTGSEWDKDTLWCYQSKDGFNLIVSNGSMENINARAAAYKRSKGLV